LFSAEEDEQIVSDLNIPEMSDMLQSDWVKLAREAGVKETDILTAQVIYSLLVLLNL